MKRSDLIASKLASRLAALREQRRSPEGNYIKRYCVPKRSDQLPPLVYADLPVKKAVALVRNIF